MRSHKDYLSELDLIEVDNQIIGNIMYTKTKLIDVSRGFKSCKKYNICLENGTYPAAMMVKELKPDVLDKRKWVCYQSPVFEIDEQEAGRFDEGLKMMKEKRNHILNRGFSYVVGTINFH